MVRSLADRTFQLSVELHEARLVGDGAPAHAERLALRRRRRGPKRKISKIVQMFGDCLQVSSTHVIFYRMFKITL